MKQQLQTIREALENAEKMTIAEHVKSLDALSELERMAGEPVHWRAVLDPVQAPHQWKTSMHVVGFSNKQAVEGFVAEQADFYNWRYTIEPLYAAPVAQQPQIVGEVLPRWDTEKERVDGVRAHMHKELPIDTKLYAYLPAESKPLFPSGAPEAIEKARNLGMDLS